MRGRSWIPEFHPAKSVKARLLGDKQVDLLPQQVLSPLLLLLLLLPLTSHV